MSRTSALVVVLFICSTTVFAQDNKPYSVGARSLLYEMSVNVQPLADGQVQYDIRITDLSTNSLVAEPRVSAAADMPAEARSEVGGLVFAVRIHPRGNALGVELEVDKDGTILDSIHAGFNLRSRQPHLDAPGALRIGGDVKAPIAIKRVEPMYTEQARKDRIAGVVILEVLIDETGAVRDAVPLKDLPDGLSQAAIDAVKQWEFQPATRNGVPVRVIFNLTVSFKLQGAAARQ